MELTESIINNNQTPLFQEIDLDHDPFAKARLKGPRQWMVAHIFHRSNKIFILLWFISTISYLLFDALIMVLIGEAIDSFSSPEADLIAILTPIIIVALGSPIFGLLSNFARELVAQHMEKETRQEFYLNLLGKSQAFHDEQRIGDIMARTTNDVRNMNFLISPALSLISEAVIAITMPYIFILQRYPPELVIAPSVFLVVFVIALRKYYMKLSPITKELQDDFGELNTTLNESLSGIEVVKTLAKEKSEIRKYYKIAEHYKDTFIHQGIIQAKYIPILFVALTITFGLLHGVYLAETQGFTLGNIVSYIGLLFNLRFPTFISIWAFATISRAQASAERLIETMNKKSEVDEKSNAITQKITGKIEFKNVHFSYPGSDKEILHNLTFKVLPGQTVAIVGETGTGKTTATKLISRLYDISSGSILIDNVPIEEYSFESLRSQIAYIEQDIFLFSSSIAENIGFGRRTSIEEVKKVAQEAQANEFIEELPEGYDSKVGERGVQLSGGERQRIAIARAFLSNPQILILDDSTSAIDSNTEEKIQQAISRILEGRTTFLITHRLSQIRWADLILVFKNGTIIAQGTHQSLLKESPEYQNIFIKRFDKSVESLLQDSEKDELNIAEQKGGME